MIKMNISVKNQENQQEGFASIVVALILVTVLSLITLGFAQITRTEQQNALNNHLALQANYAAESKINQLVSSASLVTDNSCDRDANAVVSGSNVSIRCVLVNINPESILFNNVQSGSGKASLIETTSYISSIKVGWSSNTGSSKDLRADKKNPKAAEWTSPGLVQMSITPLNDLNREALINNTYNVFLYPMSSGDGKSVDASSPTNKSGRYGVTCDNTTKKCSATIYNLPSSNKFLVHFVVYYDTNSTVTLSPLDGSGNAVATTNTQAEIDVTAKAQDVLKRLRVRAPLGANKNLAFSIPDYALEAGNICKRIAISEDNTGNSTASFKDTDNSNAELNSACNLISDN
jgi:Tfp pilus assembly protein PilX